MLIICILSLLFINNSSNVSTSNSETQSTSTDVISESISKEMYYVTPSGKRYHKNNCIIIKYKNNLTELRLNDAVNQGYTPCLICNPQPWILMFLHIVNIDIKTPPVAVFNFTTGGVLTL